MREPRRIEIDMPIDRAQLLLDWLNRFCIPFIDQNPDYFEHTNADCASKDSAHEIIRLLECHIETFTNGVTKYIRLHATQWHCIYILIQQWRYYDHPQSTEFEHATHAVLADLSGRIAVTLGTRRGPKTKTRDHELSRADGTFSVGERQKTRMERRSQMSLVERLERITTKKFND